jgi:lipoprotein-releasing system ATP-binding protein
MNKQNCLVELRKINKIYPGGVETHVLHDIDLRIEPGEFAGLVGPSGSGKTTLLNIVGLLDTPTSGEVSICDMNAARLDEDERARLRREYIGFIFQQFYLLPEFTALENALMPCRLAHCEDMEERTEMVRHLLEQVGLGDRIDYRPSQLSGGQQQRVAIVRALSNDPAFVLADEPTGTLDTKSGRMVFDLMHELNRTTGKSFLMVTHAPALAAESDRMIHIEDGRIVGGGDGQQ